MLSGCVVSAGDTGGIVASDRMMRVIAGEKMNLVSRQTGFLLPRYACRRIRDNNVRTDASVLWWVGACVRVDYHKREVLWYAGHGAFAAATGNNLAKGRE